MRTVPGKLWRNSREWRQIGTAYGYLLLAWWRLSVRRQRIDQWLFQDATAAEVSNLPKEEDRRSIVRCARWINAAARYPLPWAKCLQRSLALCLLLECRGFHTQLKIGVRKSDDGLQAHAWVEYCGRVLNDSQDISLRFTQLNGGREIPSMQQLSRAIRR